MTPFHAWADAASILSAAIVAAILSRRREDGFVVVCAASIVGLCVSMVLLLWEAQP